MNRTNKPGRKHAEQTPVSWMAGRGRRIAWLALLAMPALASCGGSASPTAFAGELEFRAEQPFLPGFSFDSGWLPEGSPVAIRAAVTAGGAVTVVAHATTDGSELMPVAGSGQLSVSGSLGLELSAKIDTNGLMYDGVVDSFDYTIEPASTMFDPFSVDSSVKVESTLPPTELGRVPIPSLPGATLVLEVTGGTVSTSFAGVCAESRDGYGQYVGALTTGGTVTCAATVEIEIPLIGGESFGPYSFDVPIPDTTSALDLGTLSLATGEPGAAMGVCGDATADTGSAAESDGPSVADTGATGQSDSDSSVTEGGQVTSQGTTEGNGSETSGVNGTATGGMTAGEADTGSMDMCVPGMCDQCGNAQSCVNCAQDMGGECVALLEACIDSDDCYLVLTCANDCMGQMCVDECRSRYPNGADAHSALIDCLALLCG